MQELIPLIRLPGHNDDIPATDAQRLFHGRGHQYPGFEHICIDWIPPVAVISLFREENDEALNRLADYLQSNIDGCCSVQLQERFLSQAPYRLLRGKQIDALDAIETGLKYGLTLGKSQNHGLFFDMRNGRNWVRANANDKNVLNLFAYTCAFSVAAIAGGARQVVNIDIAKAPLARGRDNHRLNGHPLERVKFEGVDIFKSYARLRKYGPYDLLICDPPSFQKGSVNIQRDYGKIIRRVPQLIADHGLLMLCLNSPDLDQKFLKDTVAQECPECEFIEELSPPDVFIDAVAGKGLKVLIYRYRKSE
ncbi:class I SAM-dependent methyltransferase [Thalassotalea mangrovi]|uniref:Methyltransferase domain-containing protein n=1 Tax=Thalassotalea mangrovi TaxID=2572245 RepID=A0A4U1B9R4_9GAMM|nr:class I SAM-dependent methyltransferase [Thalassotalea mangrovi]TKB47134.1 methyltransferase domain-containing protein [Thalassotalea mangrovi]